ncbi:MAG: rhomboid family intramembrane serine protease [Anaerolineales bacterium]|nr:rhomboid family intramembrane serine protease [Anaerolineales bacterium]
MTETQDSQQAIEHPTRRRPSLSDRIRAAPVTFSLIGLTSLIFLGQMLTTELIGYDLLLTLGAKEHRAIEAGQIWRYFTPIVLHVDPLHLLVNMYSLYIIGPPVERPYGPLRYGLVYLLSGLGGVAASLAFSTHPSAGASGAIFGLLGALAAFLYIHRNYTGPAGRGQLRHIVLVAVINLAIGLSPGIDNWGHFGGLLTGVGLAFGLGPRYRPDWDDEGAPEMKDQRAFGQIWPRALLAAAVVAVLAWAAVNSPFRG